MNITIIKDNKKLREWLDNNSHSKISLDTETCPSKVFYDKYIEDMKVFIASKLEPKIYKSEAKKLGIEAESYKEMLWYEATLPFYQELELVDTIDKAREYTREISEILCARQVPIIESYFDGGEKAALRYYYLDVEAIQLYNGENVCYIDLLNNPNREKIIQVLRYSLINEVKILRLWNAPFDLSVLDKIGISYKNIDHIFIYDGMVADHLLDETRSHKLKDCAKDFLGAKVMEYEEARKYGLDSKEWLMYSVNDVVWTWELAEYQQPLLIKEGLHKLYAEVEAPFVWCLVEMKVNGIKIDLEKLKELRLDCEKQIEITLLEIYEDLNIPYSISFDDGGKSNIESEVNLNSSKQLIEIFDRLGLEITETTPKGEKSVGKLTLEKHKDNFFVSKLIKYKALVKLLNSYLGEDGQIIQNLDGDGYVRPNFRQTGTKTLRLSCNSPNMQTAAVDKVGHGIEFRDILIAENNRIMIVSDWVSQENMLLAVVSDDESFKRLIKDGGDLHLANANAAFDLGLSEDMLFSSHKDFESIKEKYSKERKKAKSISFGVAYRISAYGLAKQMKCSEEEAQTYIDKYFNKFPGVKKSMEESDYEIRNNGYVTNLFGYRRRFTPSTFYGKTDYTPGDFREGFNFKIQSLGAYMMKRAMYDIYCFIKQNTKYEIKIIMTTHDEIAVTCKEEFGDEVVLHINKLMENCVKLPLPVLSDTHKGKRYSDAK